MPKALTPRYKFRGPETWAAVREAYVAGETAQSVADRFDVTVGAIRQRARRGGWSRRALAAASEVPLARARAAGEPAPPRDADASEAAEAAPVLVAPGEVLEPHEALDAALVAAARHLAAGRQAHAESAVRMGQALAELAETAARLRPITLEQMEERSTEAWAKLVGMAEDMVVGALTDPSRLTGRLRIWAEDWRRENAEGLGLPPQAWEQD